MTSQEEPRASRGHWLAKADSLAESVLVVAWLALIVVLIVRGGPGGKPLAITTFFLAMGVVIAQRPALRWVFQAASALMLAYGWWRVLGT